MVLLVDLVQSLRLELAQKAMLDKDTTLTIVSNGQCKNLKKEGDVDGST